MVRNVQFFANHAWVDIQNGRKLQTSITGYCNRRYKFFIYTLYLKLHGFPQRKNNGLISISLQQMQNITIQCSKKKFVTKNRRKIAFQQIKIARKSQFETRQLLFELSAETQIGQYSFTYGMRAWGASIVESGAK